MLLGPTFRSAHKKIIIIERKRIKIEPRITTIVIGRERSEPWPPPPAQSDRRKSFLTPPPSTFPQKSSPKKTQKRPFPVFLFFLSHKRTPKEDEKSRRHPAKRRHPAFFFYRVLPSFSSHNRISYTFVSSLPYPIKPGIMKSNRLRFSHKSK